MFVVFFLAWVLSIPKKLLRTGRKKVKKKNHDNWLKNKKVIQGQKMSKNAQKTPNFYVKKT